MVTVARAGENPGAMAVISYFPGTRLLTINVPLSFPMTSVVVPLVRFLIVSFAFGIGEPVEDVILPAMDLPIPWAGALSGTNPSRTTARGTKSKSLIINWTPLSRLKIYSWIEKQNLNAARSVAQSHLVSNKNLGSKQGWG